MTGGWLAGVSNGRRLAIDHFPEVAVVLAPARAADEATRSQTAQVAVGDVTRLAEGLGNGLRLGLAAEADEGLVGAGQGGRQGRESLATAGIGGLLMGG